MEVELPAAKPRSGACFLEVSRRRGDFALIGVACTVRLDEEERCNEARASGCAMPEKRRSSPRQASESLAGRHDRRARDRRSGRSWCSALIDPGGSIHASKEFQRHIAGVLTARALRRGATNGRGMSH